MRLRSICAVASITCSGLVLPWQAPSASAATPSTETRQVLVSNQNAGTGCFNQQVIIADAIDGRLIQNLGKPSFMDGALSDAKPFDLNRKVVAVWGGHDDSTPTNGVSDRPGGIAVYDRDAGIWSQAYRLPHAFKTGEGNAHSVAVLPGGYFAAALVGPLNYGSQWGHVVVLKPPAANGDHLQIVHSVELDGAHGVEWDSARKEVFAIGHDHLARYTFGSDLKLHLVRSYDLPRSPTGGTPGGHDIRKRRDVEGDYFVTTNSNVYEFKPDTGVFSAPLTKTSGSAIGGGVKSIDDRFDGLTAYSQPKDKFLLTTGASATPNFCMASYKHSRWIWAKGEPVYRDDGGTSAPPPSNPPPAEERRFVWGDHIVTANSVISTTGTDDSHLWVGGAAWTDASAVKSEIQRRVTAGKIPYVFFYHWGDSGSPGMENFHEADDTDLEGWETFATKIAEGIGRGNPAYVVIEPEWDLNLKQACTSKYKDALREVVRIFRDKADEAILVNGMGFWSMSADWGVNTSYNCFDEPAGWFDLHGFTTHIVSEASYCRARTSNYGGPYDGGKSEAEARDMLRHVRAKAGHLRTLFQVNEVILYDVGITRCGWGSSVQNDLFDMLGDALPALYDEIGLRGAYIRNGGPDKNERALGIENEGQFEYKSQPAGDRVDEARTLIQNHLKTFGSPTPSPTFASSATAQDTAAPGETVSISASVTNKSNGLADGVVTVEVWNGTTLVDKGTWNDQDFAASQGRAYTYDWPVPATASGTYTVKIGVFGPNGTPTYHWNGNADTIGVAAGSTRPAFTSSAAPATAVGGTNASVNVTVNNVGGALANGIVDVEVYNDAGTKLGQTVFDGQHLAAGSTTQYTATWRAAETPGTYTVKVGVFGPDWTPNYHWNDAAGTVTVTNAAYAFASSATASRTTVVPGGTTTITATVRNTGTAPLSGGVVDLEAYDAGGVRRGQQYFTGQSIAPGASQTYTWTWTAPTTSGTYAVKIGVFSSDWSTTHHWNDRAVTIGVTPIDLDTTASASPAVAGPGGTTTITATVVNNGGALENGIVQTELYDPSGVRVDTESWTQSFASGQSVSFPWTVTMPSATGAYKVKVGVFGPGWTPTHDWNGNAATVTVMAPTFTSSADVSASTVSPGGTVNVTATFTNNGGELVNGIPQIEIHNSAGSRVARYDWDRHTFRNGQTLSFAYTWTAPATTGTYTVKLMVFGSTWTPTYHWNGTAATISVGSTFQPSFRVGDGANTWWIEVYTSSDVTGVDVIGDDGTFYMSLPKKSWGAWAASPPTELDPGELVRFVARRSSDGATAGSSNFGWLTQTPTTNPGWAATFTIGSGANANWVEVYVSSAATSVEVKVGTGAFTALTKQSWGAWTKSMSVPAGSKVVFRATRSDGARAYSPIYTWLQ